MGSAADEKGGDLVSLLTSSGLLKFVGGLVVGAVLGALGGGSLGGGSKVRGVAGQRLPGAPPWWQHR